MPKPKTPRKDRPEPAPDQASRADGGPRWHARTLGEVAQFFGLQLQTVKEWRTGPNPMPGSEGAWPLDQIVQWKLGRSQSIEKVNSARMQELDLEEAELDLYVKKVKVRDTLGELVSRSAAKAQVEDMFNRIRQRVQALPEELANGIPAENRAECLGQMQQKVKLVMREIEEWGLDDSLGEGRHTKRR